MARGWIGRAGHLSPRCEGASGHRGKGTTARCSPTPYCVRKASPGAHTVRSVPDMSVTYRSTLIGRSCTSMESRKRWTRSEVPGHRSCHPQSHHGRAAPSRQTPPSAGPLICPLQNLLRFGFSQNGTNTEGLLGKFLALVKEHLPRAPRNSQQAVSKGYFVSQTFSRAPWTHGNQYRNVEVPGPTEGIFPVSAP